MKELSARYAWQLFLRIFFCPNGEKQIPQVQKHKAVYLATGGFTSPKAGRQRNPSLPTICFASVRQARLLLRQSRTSPPFHSSTSDKHSSILFPPLHKKFLAAYLGITDIILLKNIILKPSFEQTGILLVFISEI